MLEFQVNCILETDWDLQTQSLKAAFEHAQRTLQPFPRPGLPAGVEMQSFRRMYAAFLAHHQRFMQVVTPYIDTHPDGASLELISAVQKSIFAQAYLRNLEQPDQDWLITDLGLRGEYVPYQEPATTERHCGGCGGAISVVAGARRIVCERCGHNNDVERQEISCSNCNAPVSIPTGATRFPCPYCSVDMQVN
jgi:DNA-directed RNA polymerase subunit RPC12/RpoP